MLAHIAGFLHPSDVARWSAASRELNHLFKNTYFFTKKNLPVGHPEFFVEPALLFSRDCPFNITYCNYLEDFFDIVEEIATFELSDLSE